MRSRDIENYKKRLKLSHDQKEILIGVLLGDATLETQNNGRTYRMKIEHSFNQRKYVEHLYSIFKDWVLSRPRIRNVKLSNGKTYQSLAFSTVSHASFRFYAHQFYRGRKKIVSRSVGKLLKPKSLAYWFMDDGSIKSKQSKGIILNTQGYTKEDVEKLTRILAYRFQLEAKKRRQREGYQIYISGKSFEVFKKLVHPYILPEMKYKLPEARRTHLPKL